MITDTGLSEKQVALYLDGITDYYGSLKKEGHINNEQFQNLTKEAKDKLFSGAYAKNNDTFPE